MLYKNTVFDNQMSPFPAIIFVSNMYIKSVTVHYVNPIASSLVCTCVLPWWRLNLANWKHFSVLLLHGPSNVILVFVRVRQNLDASALRDADFRNLYRVSCKGLWFGTRNLLVPDTVIKLLADYNLQLSIYQTTRGRSSRIQFADTHLKTA